MRRGLLLALALLIGAPAYAAEQAPLTRREVKDRTAKLPEEHRQFLIEVEPILLATERDTFLRLETDPQRDAFIDDFWRRRDLAAGLTNFGAKDDYYARVDFVRDNFGQIASDRGRIYLTRGRPQAIIDIKCSRYFQPLQIWKYALLKGVGRDFSLLFYLPRQQREYRLWNAFGPADIVMKELLSDDIDSARRLPDNIYFDCENGDELLKAITQMRQDNSRLGKLFDPPAINGEDVNRILRSVVLSDPNAPKLEATMSVAYPEGDGRNTDAQIRILVPRAQLKTTAVAGAAVYTVDVVGEILRDGKMWEKYRYRFDFPGDAKDEAFPLVIDRSLRPAVYRARIKLTDPASGAQAILEADLTVPEIAAAQTVEGATLSAIRDELQSTRARLRIVPLTDGVVSGVQTIRTLASGSGIAGVEFWLDGRKVATRRAPPFALDLDFGTVPRPRRVRVVALDSHGEAITGDEVVLNTGTDPFRVRIVSPRIAPKLSGPARVEIEVRVPEGKKVSSVELFWNETKVATMFDPPFIHTVTIPKTDGVGYLRAVATLAGSELDPVEDLVMVNTPDYMETLDIHLVELPATVLVDGKPVHDLEERAFTVLDEGQPVKLAKFEHVRDLPLSIGMAVDASGSMETKMTMAREAGAAFFKNVLKERDKAFLVAFDFQPHVLQKWSGDLKEIFTGLARIRAEESTALYDAVVYSLYNFLGVKGQRALVLVTDGKDTASKFTFEQALEYAQRAAVPIYAIGVGIRGSEVEVKSKLNRFCGDTGGTAYYIDAIADLAKIYDDIQNELRSQYVLGFYPDPAVRAGGPWRSLTVEVPTGKVKTIRGYYP